VVEPGFPCRRHKPAVALTLPRPQEAWACMVASVLATVDAPRTYDAKARQFDRIIGAASNGLARPPRGHPPVGRAGPEGKEVMGRRSTWTSKDDDLLRALAASGENSAAIAARLKRTAAGIRKRATSLGIGLAGSRKALGLKAKGEPRRATGRASTRRALSSGAKMFCMATSLRTAASYFTLPISCQVHMRFVPAGTSIKSSH
jgi:hypothetical protein